MSMQKIPDQVCGAQINLSPRYTLTDTSIPNGPQPVWEALVYFRCQVPKKTSHDVHSEGGITDLELDKSGRRIGVRYNFSWDDPSKGKTTEIG